MSAHEPVTLWKRGQGACDSMVEAYFAQLGPEDKASWSLAAGQEWVRKHIDLAEQRLSGSPNIGISALGGRTMIQIVADDMPHLVESVTAEVSRHELPISVVVHPILLARRDVDDRRLESLHALPVNSPNLSSGDTQSLPSLALLVSKHQQAEVESWIALEVSTSLSAESAEALRADLIRVLGDVSVSHRDQSAMQHFGRIAAEDVRTHEELDESVETAEFVDWMAAGNFLFLGTREYMLRETGAATYLEPVPGTGLGVLSDIDGEPRPKSSSELSAPGAARAREKKALVVTKGNSRSTVRRRSFMDYIALKTFDSAGEVVGERRLLGLFSQSAYTQSIWSIPLLRSRTQALLERNGFPIESHSGHDLLQILETYPRNELMQMDIAEIQEFTLAILQLQERRRVKLLLRADHYGRFATALLFLPRDRYNTAVRLRIEARLKIYFGTDIIDYNIRLSSSVLARIFFRIRLNRSNKPEEIDINALEQELAYVIRSWSEGITADASELYAPEEAAVFSSRWAEAFPADYRVRYEVSDALSDAAEFHALEASPHDGPRLTVQKSVSDEDTADIRLKLYLQEQKTLSDTLPQISDFGLSIVDERAYAVTTTDDCEFYLYDLGLCYPKGLDPSDSLDEFIAAYRQVLTGYVESDVFSSLVLHLGLPMRHVNVLRAYARYMRQLSVSHSYEYTAEALRSHPQVTRALIHYFTQKFDPAMAPMSQREAHSNDDTAVAESVAGLPPEVKMARDAVVEALETVSTLNADRVLSLLLQVIDATDRTNLYQNHPWISFKLRPEVIDVAPRPRPAHEMWVYSPQVEGTHMRFDAIARGGLRWSDRSEDFRTEVLGLVKAQQVKNSVIVPAGAKGGFFPKSLPDPRQDREGWLAAGRAAYVTFIRGLLDITDNQRRSHSGSPEILTPENVRAYDDADPYLVVAADKGTATFSDTANEVSTQYQHWLGDAFASGGSVGYDHKAMGITARGAWESVKSHFAALGHDTQTEAFTVVGIGDMGGDVFGNGMLLSEHIELVAAFNHLHIFIDPNPDAATSFTERQRLFTADARGWDAYNSELISAGGGVFSRTARAIEISEEMASRFDISASSLTPPELISALLKAPADLLYNGGIGTYVKATDETHDDVGDRANNAIRVNGSQLRAAVVAEGGNLGLTQAGRIEAAHNSVLINTDAIDNSAGVDCSDHEVNIKILLDTLVNQGHLEGSERSELLEEMTEDVAQKVLENNRDQNVLLKTDRYRLADWSPSFGRLMDWLIETTGMDRALEVLPNAKTMNDRLTQGLPALSAPELAVLAAYAKIQAKSAVVNSALMHDPWFVDTLVDYFPQQLGDRFAEEIRSHPLGNRIIANEIANEAVNIGGATFVFRAVEETNAEVADVLSAFVITRKLFRLDEFDAAMRELPVSVAADQRSGMYVDMRRLLDRGVRWFLNRRHSGEHRDRSIDDLLAIYQPHVSSLYGQLRHYLGDHDRQRVENKRRRAENSEVSEPLADWYAELFEAFSLLDIAELAHELDTDSGLVARIYYRIYDDFEVDYLLQCISSLPRKDKWQALARGALRDELYTALTAMTATTIATTDSQSETSERVEHWKSSRTQDVLRITGFLEHFREEESSIASLTVVLRHMKALAGA